MLTLSWLTSNHLIFIIPTIAILYLGFKQFTIDKEHYKGMLNSARKDVPVWRILLLAALFIVFLSVPFPTLNMEGAQHFYLTIVVAGFFMGMYYQKYTHSLRSFPEGIKLPGKNAALIPWKKIIEINIVDETVDLKLIDDTETIQIDRRDMKEIAAIVETWKSTHFASQ